MQGMTIAIVLTAALALPLASAVAQTPTTPRTETRKPLTPAQHEQMKVIDAKAAACHKKAIAEKVSPPARRAFMKNCLSGK